MKIFLTGATGYIGSEFLKKLVATGDEIVALYHKQAPDIQAPNLHWVQGSLDDTASLVNAMDGCGQVYHMAGLARISHPDKNAFFDINVKGTENILEAAKITGVEKLVYTSTAAVFSYSIKTPITENDPLLEPLNDDYSVTKFIAETKVLEANKKGLKTVVVNPPRVYGPGKATESNPVNKLIEDFLRKSYYLIPGDGHFYGNYAFIDDVIQGHLLAMEKGVPGERYILGGENHDFTEFYGLLEQLTNRKRHCIHISKRIMNIVSGLAGLWSSFSGKSPKVTPSIVSKIFSNRLLSCDKAIQDLGYQVTPFAKGLQLTLASIQTNYHEYKN